MPANWYYENEGIQLGPFTDEEFNGLVQIGKITSSTHVWHEGLTGWMRFAELNPSAPPQPSSMPCAECGRTFSAAEMIQLQGRYVCAGCKPIAIQRMKEGSQISAESADPNQLLQDVERRDYNFNIGENISRAWELVKANLPLSVGVTFVVLLVSQAPSIVPIIGPIASLVLMGPMYGGLYYFFFKMVRRQPLDFADGFKGFGPKFGQLVGAQLIPILLIDAILVPAVVAGIALGAAAGGFHKDAPPFIVFGLILLALPFLVYFGLSWMFTVPLVMDKGIRFWDAMTVSRKAVGLHWGRVFLYVFVAGLINIVGILACGVGLLITLPIFFCAVVLLYENIFNGITTWT